MYADLGGLIVRAYAPGSSVTSTIEWVPAGLVRLLVLQSVVGIACCLCPHQRGFFGAGGGRPARPLLWVAVTQLLQLTDAKNSCSCVRWGTWPMGVCTFRMFSLSALHKANVQVRHDIGLVLHRHDHPHNGPCMAVLCGLNYLVEWLSCE